MVIINEESNLRMRIENKLEGFKKADINSFYNRKLLEYKLFHAEPDVVYINEKEILDNERKCLKDFVIHFGKRGKVIEENEIKAKIEKKINYKLENIFDDEVEINSKVKTFSEDFEITEDDYLDFEKLDCGKLLEDLKKYPYLYSKSKIKKPLESYLKFINNKMSIPIGVDSELSKEEKIILYNNLIKQDFIYGEQENFIAALTPEVLPSGFEPIKWLIVNKQNNFNKTSFVTFMNFCRKNNNSNWRKEAKFCFRDKDGKTFNDLRGVKKDDFYDYWYKKFTSMI